MELRPFTVPIIDDFPKSKYGYWLLYWIGGFTYESGQYYCDYYFINFDGVTHASDAKRVCKTFEASMVWYFKIGAILKQDGRTVASDPSYYRSYKDCITVDFKGRTVSSEKFPLKDAADLPLPEPEEREGFKFIYKNVMWHGRITIVLIPVIVLLQHYFLNTQKAAEIIISGSFSDYFTGRKIFKDQGSIYYDNNKLLPHDVHTIASYYFYHFPGAISAMSYVSGYLREKLISKQGSIYPDIKVPIKDTHELSFCGQYFMRGGKEYFIANSVVSMNLPLKNSISVKVLPLSSSLKYFKALVQSRCTARV